MKNEKLVTNNIKLVAFGETYSISSTAEIDELYAFSLTSPKAILPYAVSVPLFTLIAPDQSNAIIAKLTIT